MVRHALKGSGKRNSGEVLWESDLVEVPAGMSFRELVRVCLMKQRVPKVVCEFGGISVGGAFVGGGIESSSWKWGGFSETCQGVLIDGSWSFQGEEIFKQASGSYGVVGRVERLKIETVEARDVEVSFDESLDLQGELVEGVVFEDRVVRIKARFSEKKGRPLKGSFFQRVLHAKNNESEVLKLEDYLFRWDKGAFWMERFLYPAINTLSFWIPFLRKRALKTLPSCDAMKAPFWWKSFSTDLLYKVLHQIPENLQKEVFVIQDCTVPLEGLEEFLSFIRSSLKVFPLWLCPVKGSSDPYSFNYGQGALINVGIYGACNRADKSVELLEKKVFDLRGRKMLYSHNYYDQQMFFKIYGESKTSKALFDKVR